LSTIADIMSTDILTVRLSATLGEVARTLRGRNVGSAIVVDDGGVHAGIITERELVDSVAASRNPDQGQAASWMRTDYPTILATAAMDEATESMRDANVRHLPVVDEGGVVVGVISIRDLLVGTR